MSTIRAKSENRRREGLTLVELLVVIVILGLVTAATIPLMQPATAQRRMREASRMVATVLANAQARALSTGRPVGVMFQRLSKQPATPSFKTPHHSIEMFLCEVPSPYTGETSQASAQIGPTSPPSQNERLVALWERPPSGIPSLPAKTVRNGDRIRFNYRGHFYTIEGNTSLDTEGYLTGGTFKISKLQNQQFPQVVGTIPYQIFRQPRKTADPPAQMPVGSIVDLEYAGFASDWIGFFEGPRPGLQTKLSFHQPVIVMFGPAGNFQTAYWGLKDKDAPDNDPGALIRTESVTAPFYLLIGQPPGDDAITQGRLNHINFDHVWIAINPQSGLVTTSEVASEFNEPTEPNDADVNKELNASRSFARSAQNMGGR